MKLGFGLPTGGTRATVENVTVLARHAEALGYSSLWVFQRLLCPVAPLNGYKGTFYFVPSSRVEPKPVQKPRPPLLIGGYSEASFQRAGRLGDGYTGGNMAPEKMAHIVTRVREHAEGAGRDPARVIVASRGSFRVTSTPQGQHRSVFCGSLQPIRDDVRRYEDAGVSEVFLDPSFQFPECSITDVLRQMEALAPKGA